MSGTFIGEAKPRSSVEAQLVQEIFDLDPAELSDRDLSEYENLVKIVGLFSRVNPESGAFEHISPTRISAIPAITARHINLVKQARGILTPQQVYEVWFDNMPENTGLRHPDLLFDIAQYNFGTDEPIDDVLRAINRAEERRRELIAQYQGEIRQRAAQYRYERDLDDDAPEELLDAWADSMTGRG